MPTLSSVGAVGAIAARRSSLLRPVCGAGTPNPAAVTVAVIREWLRFCVIKRANSVAGNTLRLAQRKATQAILRKVFRGERIRPHIYSQKESWLQVSAPV